MFKKIKKQNQGIALLWVLVLIIVMLIITGSMSSLIIKELTMSLGIDLSEQAYAAAKSGIEVGRKLGCEETVNVERSGSGILDTDLTYDVKTKKQTNGKCNITSIGSAGPEGRKVARKISSTQEQIFGTADVMVFPDNADTPATKVEGEDIFYFVDKADDGTIGKIVKDGNGGGKFFQQFDLTIPSTGQTYAGTYNNVTNDFVVVGGTSSGFQLVTGPLYSWHMTEIPLVADETMPTPGTTIRYRINYDENKMKVAVLKSDAEGNFKCIAASAQRNVGAYAFSKLAIFTDGASLENLSSHSGIKIYPTEAVLMNMVLTGTVNLPPTISLDLPNNITTPTYVIQPTVSANVVKVEFRIDSPTGTLLCTDTVASFECTWDVSGYDPGSSHTVFVTAYDGDSPAQTATDNDSAAISLFNITVSQMLEGGGAGIYGRVASSPPGIDCGPGHSAPSDCSHNFNPSEYILFTAANAAGYEFVRWVPTGASCQAVGGPANECRIPPPNSVTLVAYYKVAAATEYRVTVRIHGGGFVYEYINGEYFDSCLFGTCTSGPVAPGTTVVLEHNEIMILYPWLNWGGDCSGTAKTCTLIMNSDKSVDAYWAK